MTPQFPAEVVELADELRSGRSGQPPVWVRIPPSAPERRLAEPLILLRGSAFFLFSFDTDRRSPTFYTNFTSVGRFPGRGYNSFKSYGKAGGRGGPAPVCPAGGAPDRFQPQRSARILSRSHLLRRRPPRRAGLPRRADR